MKSPKDFEQFLDSLDAARGETHRVLIPQVDILQQGDEVVVVSCSVVGILSKINSMRWEPCDERDIGRKVLKDQIARRAESRTPPDLKEQVKVWVLAAMDAAKRYEEYGGEIYIDLNHEFRRLCEPNQT